MSEQLTELDKKMDFWIKNGLNVLLEGQQGVGKSALIEAMAKRNNLNYKYFSGSLIDPYLTLVGVPREATDEDGNSYLDYIKPLEFSSDEDLGIEFLFIDELNRSPKPVLNALMELIQFKSINGVKLPNLKAVWAAVNPYDDNESFHVTELDPAQKDRFQVQYKIPFEPSSDYFTDKFGERVSKIALKWWNKIPEDYRQDTSPRRLDYALGMWQLGGDIKDVLAENTRPDALLTALKSFSGDEGSHIDRWMTDAEGYLDEITDRVNPTEVDVVEAFAELKKLSMDQAVDYSGKLLPEQIRKIADSEGGHVDILLRNYNGPNDKSVETILEETQFPEQHVQFMLNGIEDEFTEDFAEAYKEKNIEKMLETAHTGLDYSIIVLWSLNNEDSETSGNVIKAAYENTSPAILRDLVRTSYKDVAKVLFSAPTP